MSIASTSAVFRPAITTIVLITKHGGLHSTFKITNDVQGCFLKESIGHEGKNGKCSLFIHKPRHFGNTIPSTLLWKHLCTCERTARLWADRPELSWAATGQIIWSAQ
jgi:hypothetical protein